MAVGQHGIARRGNRRAAIEVVAGVPTAEVQHFQRVQGDGLPVDFVEVTGDHALRVGHDGHAVGAQHPNLARAAPLIADQQPIGVAMQFQRAESLLEEFEAAGQRIGVGEQPFQRVIVDADALFSLQPIDLERLDGASFGDAVDGDVDPGRLLIDAGGLRVQGRALRDVMLRGEALKLWGAPPQTLAYAAKPVEHRLLLALILAQTSKHTAAKGRLYLLGLAITD